MPRDMTSNMAAALTSTVLRPAILAELSFANSNVGTSNVFIWNGLGNLVWNGSTFMGCGDLVSVGTISEDSTIEAKNVTVSLSGIPSTMVSYVLFETRILLTANIWLALFDGNNTIIGTPIMSYQGMMDQPTLNDDGQTCTMSLNLENILVDLNRPCYRRYDNDDQQVDLAATLTRLGLAADTIDKGFQFVSDVQEKIVFWGQQPTSNNND